MELLVDEEVRGFPGGDFAFPGNGNAVKAEAIADARAGGHGDRPGSEDMELEECWRQALEIVGVGEERKDFRNRPGQPDFGIESVSFHLRRKNF